MVISDSLTLTPRRTSFRLILNLRLRVEQEKNQQLQASSDVLTSGSPSAAKATGWLPGTGRVRHLASELPFAWESFIQATRKH